MTPICGESEPFVNMLTPERIRLKALPAYTIVGLYLSGDVHSPNHIECVCSRELPVCNYK
ncbi:hypothetical protein XM79_c21258 [Vibrio vulnificus]|nr:hypothetical protein XM78_c21275 [Vibrio vulnificus]OQK61774.1 hypothetical protein XM79_c21258 [Vibrio vulnificus]